MISHSNTRRLKSETPGDRSPNGSIKPEISPRVEHSLSAGSRANVYRRPVLCQAKSGSQRFRGWPLRGGHWRQIPSPFVSRASTLTKVSVRL